MPAANDILTEAAAMCGDRNQTLYTPDKLLPLLKRATRDLNLALIQAGITNAEATHVSNTVAAGILEHPNPPNDLSVPLKMWERPDTSTSDLDWVPMLQEEWDPAEPQEINLVVWQFTDDKIKFRGATEAKKVRLEYYKNLADVTGTGSTISVINADNFLSAKTASYAARFIGKNVTLGAELNNEAKESLDLLLAIRVKEDQNEVLRMLPYSMNARGRRR